MIYLVLFILFSQSMGAPKYDVCIDPGHMGELDCGVPGRDHNPLHNESDFNILFADAAEMFLTNIGFSVFRTRDTEHCPWQPKEVKAKIGMGLEPNENYKKGSCFIFVSCHNNGDKEENVHGTETYYLDAEDKKLAEAVHTMVCNYIKDFPYFKDRGVKKKGFYVLKDFEGPSCLVELAYVTHKAPGSLPDQFEQLINGQIEFRGGFGLSEGVNDYWPVKIFPPRLILEILGGRRIKLKWVPDPLEQQVTYNVYRRDHPAEEFHLIASGITGAENTDEGVNYGKVYSYYVTVLQGGNESPSSYIVTGYLPPFTSTPPAMTGFNEGSKLVFDQDGNLHLTFFSDTASWYSRSSDLGATWTFAVKLGNNFDPTIKIDNYGMPIILSLNVFLTTEPPPSQEPRFFSIFCARKSAEGWKSVVLHSVRKDSIYGVSFNVGSDDSGRVVFSTYSKFGPQGNLWRLRCYKS